MTSLSVLVPHFDTSNVKQKQLVHYLKTNGKAFVKIQSSMNLKCNILTIPKPNRKGSEMVRLISKGAKGMGAYICVNVIRKPSLGK